MENILTHNRIICLGKTFSQKTPAIKAGLKIKGKSLFNEHVE